MFKKIFLITFLSIHSLCAQHVAITQIVEHPSLNKVRDGIIDVLKSSNIKNLSYETANAHGDAATNVQIAQRFVAQKADIIVAITTPSAQAAVKASSGKIPVVFSTVTDPEGAKLISPFVAGTSNITPVKKQIELIKRAFPKAKTIGIVLNFGEDNSVKQYNQAKIIARELDITIKTSAIENSAEIQMATQRLMGKVDVIYLMMDNTVASALPVLLKIANQHNTPVVSSFVEAVEKGATLGLALDEYEIGRQTGNITLKILQGTSPEKIGTVNPNKIIFAINKEQARKYKIEKQLLIEADQIHP